MNKKFIAIALVSSTILVAATGAVQARKADGEHGPRGPKLPSFVELDLNKDGSLSKDELSSFATTRFTKADTNGDGLLSKEELTAQAESRRAKRAAKRMERLFSRKDANNDGLLSQDEMRGKFDPAKAFSRMDKDGDGIISAEEFAVLEQKRGGRRHGPKHDARPSE